MAIPLGTEAHKQRERVAMQVVIDGTVELAVGLVDNDEHKARPVDHTIGKAECTVVHTCRSGRYNSYKGGVVRVSGRNYVIVVQTVLGDIRRVVAPNNHPGEIKKHPHFSPWEAASLEDAKRIVSGEIPTRRHQPADILGNSMY